MCYNDKSYHCKDPFKLIDLSKYNSKYQLFRPAHLSLAGEELLVPVMKSV